MRFVIMGAGGVGGFYGGRLARAGKDVTFIARGPHLAALREQGLRVESPTVGDFHVPSVQATDNPAEVGAADMVWMTVKAYDLEVAAQSIQPLMGKNTAVLPLLNGVEIAERIGGVLGMEHMLGGIVQVSASIGEPGLIRHAAADRLVIGEPDGSRSERVLAIQKELADAGIEATVSEDIGKDVWLKFVRLNTYAGIASLTRMPLGAAVASAEVRALASACMDETLAIAQKKGIELEEGIGERIIEEATVKPFSGVKPSMLLDLERGRKMELEIFQGATVRMGQETGVPTPVNSFIYAALKPHAEGTS